MKASRSSIQSFLDNRRSMEQALADLVAKYAVTPSPELARIIGHLELEVAERNESAVEANAPRNPSLLAAPEPLQGEERRRGGGRHINSPAARPLKGLLRSTTGVTACLAIAAHRVGRAILDKIHRRAAAGIAAARRSL